MKYTSTDYARAFTALSLEAHGAQEEKELVKNFATFIKKNGDISRQNDILKRVEQYLRKASGKRHVVLETARPIASIQKKFAKFLESTDIVEEKVSPEIIAGVRITVDDEDQFDGSLANKLKVLFT